ncbi:D-alanine--D-alanine ligase [Wohlfahrtiimonas chitiniclastica]|uniref:D-alanine--D-alanine ligase n=1 Tax=Wohlfahrtiimonas chitiniclastica TaxID=400946 RepID=UPI001BCE135A|nr:D-alanine--D-alanine ligase [Wohlfahrtiimonas chitiniclastica]MBS7835004.1 D-alanine--D-alanine ligase [Wohlfahrtiimonas chitiniclastica]
MTIDVNQFGKVAVLLGGESSERQVSLWSGEAVLAALKRQGVDAYGVDPSEVNIAAYLPEHGFDRVMNSLHGGAGENGTIQAVLDYLNIPYTGSGTLGCAVGMDKVFTKAIWQAKGLPVLQTFEMNNEADVARVAELGIFPLAVKPSADGSSVGVSKVERAEDLLAAWHNAKGKSGLVFAEPWIIGEGEYTCGILNDQALPLIRMETDLTFYDFDAKYLRDDTRYFCPCGLDEAKEQEIRALCEQAFHAVGGKGWGRVDLVLDAQGLPWLLEVNMSPGMTGHSLVPMAANAVGMDYDALCIEILKTTL